MDPSFRSNRYDVSGNLESQYVDSDQTILVNKLGICDLHILYLEEEKGLARAYEVLLAGLRIDTALDCSLLRFIHASIFGEIYEWAGRWRTVQISKPGVIWPAAQYLDQSMSEFEKSILRKQSISSLRTDESFCQAIGEIQGEFLAIHPFREGNARTIKLFTNLMAAMSGRPFLIYDPSKQGIED